MATPGEGRAKTAASGSTGVALLDPGGTWTREQVRADARAVAGSLGRCHGERIALLCTPGHDFMAALLGCWQAGGIAVPLHPAHPDRELTYFLEDAGASVVVCSRELDGQAHRLATSVVTVAVGSSDPTTALDDVDPLETRNVGVPSP